jgi:hypothetical protein
VSLRTDVLLWAQRIVAAKRDTPAHILLEVTATAGIEDAQEAFHKVARMAHPDLHRTTLSPEELEMVTTAYSRVAGAYQEFRGQRIQTTRMRAIKDEPSAPLPKRQSGTIPAQGRVTTPPGAIPRIDPAATAGVAPSGGPTSAAGAMNSKALIYYRKAELSLRRGDLKTAVLQIKMAIAGDPQSTFLRSALIEIEAELAKK